MHRVSRRRRVAAALVALFGAGCWDVDHLRNGVRDAGSVTPGDGSGGDANPGPTCTGGAHFFCDDFEADLRVGVADGWDNKDLRGGGAVEVVTTRARSGLRSLHGSVPRNDARVALFSTLHKRFSIGTWRATRVEMNLFVPQPAWAAGDKGTAAFAIVLMPTNGGGDPVTWNFGMVGPVGSQIYAALPTPALAKGTTPTPYDRWFHVAVEWDPLGSGRFVASVDGTPFDERTLHPDTGVSAPGNAALELDVGLARFDGGGNVPTPPLEVFVDDVVVDLL